MSRHFRCITLDRWTARRWRIRQMVTRGEQTALLWRWDTGYDTIRPSICSRDPCYTFVWPFAHPSFIHYFLLSLGFSSVHRCHWSCCYGLYHPSVSFLPFSLHVLYIPQHSNLHGLFPRRQHCLLPALSKYANVAVPSHPTMASIAKY